MKAFIKTLDGSYIDAHNVAEYKTVREGNKKFYVSAVLANGHTKTISEDKTQEEATAKLDNLVASVMQSSLPPVKIPLYRKLLNKFKRSK